MSAVDAPASSDDVYDVVVVGAGPVGSTAALVADRYGLRTLLVDESTAVFPLPRAIHFDADVMRIFQSVGLADELEGRVRATAGGLHLGADGQPIRDFRVQPVEGDLGWKPHYMFYQPEVDALLRGRAADASSVTARLGWRCEGVDQDDDGAVVHLRDPQGGLQRVAARYVIAADGASSPIRKALGVPFVDSGFEEPWVIIDARVEDEDLGPDYSIMYCDPERPGTYVPGPRGHRRWEFMLLPGEDGAPFVTVDGARSLVGPVTDWIDAPDLEIERVAIYRFHALVAAEWRCSRVFLAGDAAHQTPPFYGQGMCHGIRDVRNLVWKLAAVLHDGADDALLDAYQAEREPHVRAIIDQSVANGRYICVLDPVAARERDERMRALMAQPVTQVRTFRDTIPGLVGGVLGDSGASAVGLLFPQPRVRTPDGAMRLDALLGDGWSVVTDDPSTAEAAAPMRGLVVGRDFDDEEGLLARWFGEFRCRAVVLRPDRYVFDTARDAPRLRAAVDEAAAAVGGAIEGAAVGA